jgi:hypothetical protein
MTGCVHGSFKLLLAMLFAAAAVTKCQPQIPARHPASPSTAPSASPVATPTVAFLPPDAAPQILWYQLSSTAPHAGDVVSVTVVASSNVASVEVRVGGYGFNLNKSDVGHFDGSYQVPQLPLFAPHRFTLQINARNTAGALTQVAVPIQIR